MQPDPSSQPGYVAAFEQIAQRIAESLSETRDSELPVRMFVCGGAAVHFYTGGRISNDIDATFSHRIVLPDDLEVSYPAPDGAAQLLYFDRQFNDAFALLHEDAYEESVPLELTNVDSNILDTRLLSALDLAVSKISRLASHDCEDIAALTKCGLINCADVRQRAEEAAKHYVGDLDRLKTSIGFACNIVADAQARKCNLPNSGSPISF